MRSADLRLHVAHVALGGDRVGAVVRELMDNRLQDEPALQEPYGTMSEEQARLHEGAEHPTEQPHHRGSLRLFHAWRVMTLRERMGAALAPARALDVGDVDGLMLKALGKRSLGFNLSPAAITRIEANGIEAQLGDGHTMPFDDGSFDLVLCFETLEHVESPAGLLDELARVCAPTGRVYVSIPWVPRTQIHPRDSTLPRGHAHIFEFDERDFAAVVSHSALEITWRARCDLLGRPRTPAQAAVAAAAKASHLVGGTFHRFQFIEMTPRG